MWSQGMKRCENDELRMEDPKWAFYKFFSVFKRACAHVFVDDADAFDVNAFDATTMIRLDFLHKAGCRTYLFFQNQMKFDELLMSAAEQIKKDENRELWLTTGMSHKLYKLRKKIYEIVESGNETL